MHWIRRAPQGILPTAPDRPRLGVLSGTFDPPTRSHVAIGSAALAQLALHEVLFVLPENPPHKRQAEAPLEMRAEMLRIAIEPEPKFSAAIIRQGLLLEIYEEITPHYPPDTSYFFLMGRDAAERILFHWPYEDPERALQQMFASFKFGVADRGGPFRLLPDSFASKFSRSIHHLRIPTELEDVSSTRVREAVGRGQGVEQLVPPAVEAYIRVHGLYRKKGQPVRGFPED